MPYTAITAVTSENCAGLDQKLAQVPQAAAEGIGAPPIATSPTVTVPAGTAVPVGTTAVIPTAAAAAEDDDDDGERSIIGFNFEYR